MNGDAGPGTFGGSKGGANVVEHVLRGIDGKLARATDWQAKEVQGEGEFGRRLQADGVENVWQVRKVQQAQVLRLWQEWALGKQLPNVSLDSLAQMIITNVSVLLLVHLLKTFLRPFAGMGGWILRRATI